MALLLVKIILARQSRGNECCHGDDIQQTKHERLKGVMTVNFFVNLSIQRLLFLFSHIVEEATGIPVKIFCQL